MPNGNIKIRICSCRIECISSEKHCDDFAEQTRVEIKMHNVKISQPYQSMYSDKDRNYSKYNKPEPALWGIGRALSQLVGSPSSQTSKLFLQPKPSISDA